MFYKKSGKFHKTNILYINEELIKKIKKILINNDVGLTITNNMIDKFTDLYKHKCELHTLQSFISKEIQLILEKNIKSLNTLQDKYLKNHYGQKKPLVFILLGNNGIGKTSFAMKLAKYFINNNVPKEKILLTSLDFFRAGAFQQLEELGRSINVKVLPSKNNSKGQTYDAYKYAVNNDYDILIFDTSGRIHTNENLLDEIKDIKKTLDTLGAHTESILVMDNNFGSIAISSFNAFNNVINISGIVLTKTDTNIGGGWLVKLIESNHQINLFGYVKGPNQDDFSDFNLIEYTNKILNWQDLKS
jgi:fused signal recognition particle receptor